jgi:prepilin-type processing-associated H-X9-DG protein
MPDKDYEETWTDTSKQPLLHPSLMGKLYPHNILLFDSGAVVNSESLFATGDDVDEQYFIHVDDTLARFFRADDPYSSNRFRGNSFPVITETKPDQNRDWIDPQNGTYSPGYPYQGNIRYRHNNDVVANFVFADGHVDSLRPDQVLRYMFKLRWPPGMPASTGQWSDPDDE